MISNKKSYAMKMLQLALALSLLHYNPDYLLHRWDSQLELGTHGDGWELEMLRTVHRMDMDHNPYGNRKGLSPRIEDLLNFDDPSLGGMANGMGEYKLPPRFNGSTFVMNLHNTTGNSSVQTAALQDVQSTSAAATGGSMGVGTGGAPTAGGQPVIAERIT
ncbi:GD11701 [Drosophila simulans]|uniref:GD11701 n=1 Tax=Drosophila simulans TaxID=7240 RepID=B4NVC3_DROSI|nr:GD11701 [Drosophila simulans]